MVRIIDASVAAKWFVEEPGSSRALEILEEILRKPGAFGIPELFFFELANIINRLLPKLSENHRYLLDQLLNLGIPRFSMTTELLEEIRFFQSQGLSGYDAAYVALAKILNGKWITFDSKAHKAMQKFGLSSVLAE